MTKDQIKMTEYMARDGVPLKTIRKTLGITKGEWNDYLKKNPEAESRLKMLKTVTDYEIEDAILKRARGYSYDEVRTVEKEDKGTETVTTQKEVSPDVSAASFWLKCRRSDIWNDKKAAPDDSRMDEILRMLDEEAANAK